jgi:hypothetical protein
VGEKVLDNFIALLGPIILGNLNAGAEPKNIICYTYIIQNLSKYPSYFYCFASLVLFFLEIVVKRILHFAQFAAA